jgi:hypothetical protein
MSEIHQVIFNPVGNGDTTQINLSAGRRVLFDFCHRGNAEDDDTPEIDLKGRLKERASGTEQLNMFTIGSRDFVITFIGFTEAGRN